MVYGFSKNASKVICNNWEEFMHDSFLNEFNNLAVTKEEVDLINRVDDYSNNFNSLMSF